MLLSLMLTLLTQIPGQYAWTESSLPSRAVAFHPERGVIACDHVINWGIREDDALRGHLPYAASALDVTPDGRIILLNGPGARVLVLNSDGIIQHEFGTSGNRLTQFHDPDDVASNGDRIAVADTGNRRVLLFDMVGGNMGLYDEINGTELLLPSSVAMDESGNLYIADEGTHLVHAIGPDGAHRWTTGGWGRTPGRMAEPSGLDVQDGVLLIADRMNHRIQALDADTGEVIDYWGMHAIKPREGEGRIHYPEDVAFTDEGCVVAEPFERRLQGFVPGPPLRPRALEVPGGPKSHFGPRMALQGRVLVVHEPEQRQFHVLDIDRPTPIHLTTFGSHTPGPGCVQRPIKIRLEQVDGTVHCHVTDAADGRTHAWRFDLPPTHKPKFAPDAARLLRTTAPEDGPVQSPELRREAILPDGSQARLVDDTLVIEHDEPITVGAHGSNHGEFWNASELLVDHHGRILVLDHGNHRLQAFDANGNWLMTFGTGRAYTPANTPSMRKASP
ncbi:MAG: hypothetical protein MK101_08635 [Phycisphaerales bacterium]|nr:hypothetical protein [Phycisphaerales bacterium]